MLLIADSGSTKTDWRLVDEEGKTVAKTKTDGLNPYFLTEEEMISIIETRVLPIVSDVERIYFYGAGCGLPAKADQIRKALQVIPSRQRAEVSGDILGSARSLLQNAEGTACILGTGSNSCYYNGREIVSIMPSLGFMFSDWGSGTVMSKDLISLFLQEKLPAALMEDFSDTYRLDRAQILDRIYNKPQPNRFLASFTPFLLKYSHEQPCRDIIVDNFSSFFRYYVLRYPHGNGHVKVSFTGSIAYNFRKYLREVAQDLDIEVERIVQHPMDGLVQYHCVTMPVSHEG